MDDPVAGVLDCSVLGVSIDDVEPAVLDGGGVFCEDGPATRPPMLSLAPDARTGGRPRLLLASTGLMMLVDWIEDELAMVERGLHDDRCDKTIFMVGETNCNSSNL